MFMKKLLLGFLLVFIFQITNAQFNFLEKNEGVKKIELTEVKGKRTAPKSKVKHTKFFNPDGTLQKIEYSWSIYEYYYEGDVVVEVSTTKRDTCSFAKEYHLSWEGNTLTIKEKNHTGKYTPQKICERSMVEDMYHGLAASHLFENVERELAKEEGVNRVTKIKYKDENNRDEYEQYIYRKSRRGTLKLHYLKTNQKNTNDSYLQRRFIFSPYGGQPGINMTWQAIMDQFGFQANYLGAEEFYKEDGTYKMQFEFQFDDKKNWIKRVAKKENSDNIYEKVRKIEYY